MYQDENDENQPPPNIVAVRQNQMVKVSAKSKPATLRQGLQSYTTADDLTKQQALVESDRAARQQQQQNTAIVSKFQIYCDDKVR